MTALGHVPGPYRDCPACRSLRRIANAALVVALAGLVAVVALAVTA